MLAIADSPVERCRRWFRRTKKACAPAWPARGVRLSWSRPRRSSRSAPDARRSSLRHPPDFSGRRHKRAEAGELGDLAGDEVADFVERLDVRPQPTNDVNRASGTDSDNGCWLRRLVRCHGQSISPRWLLWCFISLSWNATASSLAAFAAKACCSANGLHLIIQRLNPTLMRLVYPISPIPNR